MQITDTQRLSLDSTAEEDIDILHKRLFADPEVMRFAFAGRTLSLEECRDFVGKHFQITKALTGIGTLREKASGEIIGIAGLVPCQPLGIEDVELGFVLTKSVWGKGYATEIGKAQLDLGFNRIGLKRLIGMAHPDNHASCHVLSKLGMRYQKNIRSEDRGPRRVYLICSP